MALMSSVSLPNRQEGLASHMYPRVAVDAVLFTITDGVLKALLVKIKHGTLVGKWAFPGGLVRIGESLDEAARRELALLATRERQAIHRNTRRA